MKGVSRAEPIPSKVLYSSVFWDLGFNIVPDLPTRYCVGRSVAERRRARATRKLGLLPT